MKKFRSNEALCSSIAWLPFRACLHRDTKIAEDSTTIIGAKDYIFGLDVLMQDVMVVDVSNGSTNILQNSELIVK